MLCEECHVNEANFTVSVVAGEETTVRHLCADCMSRMNNDLVKGNVRSLLSTVLNAIRANAEEDDNRKEFSMPIFGRFTQRAQQTLMLAQRIAAELQQPYVGVQHNQALQLQIHHHLNGQLNQSRGRLHVKRGPRSLLQGHLSHAPRYRLLF